MRTYQIEPYEREISVGMVLIKIRSVKLLLTEQGSYYASQTITDISHATAQELAGLWIATEPKPITVTCESEPNMIDHAPTFR